MSQRRPMGWFAAAVTSVVLAAAATGLAADYRLITIGTSGKAGVYYSAGGAVCRAVNADRGDHGIRCLARSTEGSVSNLGAVRSGDLDIALVQSDWHHHAYHGTGVFEASGPDRELRSLFSLHAEPFTLVVRRGSAIRTIDDLKGKRVNVGRPGSGNRATVEAVMSALGWTMDDFSLAAEFTSSEQARALCDDQVDAVAYVVGHPNRSIHDMVRDCNAVLVPVTGPAIDRLVAERPYYGRASIPAHLYAGHPEAVATFGLHATVVASARTDAYVVFHLVRAVFADLASFEARHPALNGLERKQMARDGLTAPLHEGARRYYRQAGLL